MQDEKEDVKKVDEAVTENDVSEVDLGDGQKGDLNSIEDEAPLSEIDSLKIEISTLKDELLRSRAASENIRKRSEKDVVAAHKYGVERLVQDILPVKDSMEMGLEIPVDSDATSPFREGMELTAKMFNDFFEKLNVKVINPVGEMFDPEFHQAMMTEATSDADKGTVTKVMQKGYLLNDRLVRPALVVVAEEVNDSGD